MKALVFSFLVLATAAKVWSADPLPPEIQSYYDRVNFLASLSTSGERQAIGKMMKTAPEEAARLEGRLAKIRDLLQQKSMIDESGFPDQAGVKQLKPADPVFDLTEVLETEVSRNGVKVRVRTVRVENTSSQLLTISYDKASEEARLFLLKQRLLSASRLRGTLSVHQWRHTQDGWKKSPVDVVFLKL